MRAVIAFLLELPFAILSFLFFLFARAVMRRAVSAHFARHPEATKAWRVVSREQIEKPLALLATLTSVPRWNTHAVCATAGPFEARASIAIRCDSPRRTAASWAIVLNEYPAQRPVARLQAGEGQAWAEHRVSAGRYMLISRYYQLLADPELPEIRVDGVVAVPALRVSRDVNAFYEGELKRAAGLKALFLHFHVVTLLRAHRVVPASWIKKVLAPSGTPDTNYLFGVLRKGERLRFQAKESALAHQIVFDLYGRDSIPFVWGELSEREYQTEPSPRTAFYIIRILRKSEDAPAYEPGSLEVRAA